MIDAEVVPVSISTAVKENIEDPRMDGEEAREWKL